MSPTLGALVLSFWEASPKLRWHWCIWCIQNNNGTSIHSRVQKTRYKYDPVVVLCYCLPLLNYPLFFDYLLQTRTTKTNNSQENSQVTSSMYFVFFVPRISTNQQSRTPNQPININQPLFDLLWERWICMTPTDTFLTLSCWEESGRFTIHNIHLPMLVHQPFRRTNAEAQGRRCRFTDHNICVYIYIHIISQWLIPPNKAGSSQLWVAVMKKFFEWCVQDTRSHFVNERRCSRS